MRILRVAQKIYPEVPGGGTYHVHAMSRDQAGAVSCYTVEDQGEAVSSVPTRKSVGGAGQRNQESPQPARHHGSGRLPTG